MWFLATRARNFWFFFPLALKSSLKSHQMTTFLAQKRGLSEKIIIWVKTLWFWTNKVVIWWLFNDNFRAREKRNQKIRAKLYIFPNHHSDFKFGIKQRLVLSLMKAALNFVREMKIPPSSIARPNRVNEVLYSKSDTYFYITGFVFQPKK